MAQSLSCIVLVAALILGTPHYCCAENMYCVTPTASSGSSCPHNSTHCATLSEYAQEAASYLTSDTTMVFLPGDHILDVNITLASVANLTMCGESSRSKTATIVCNGPVGLSFTTMVDFKVISLGFASCSRKDVPRASNYAVLLQSTQHAEIANCSFHDNPGTALVVSNSSIILAGNKFTHNHCRFSACVGGAITAFSSNLTFSVNTLSFLTKYVDGDHTFDVTNSFINNSAAKWGGAIYASDNTTIHFNGSNNFINNSAKRGGAIFTSHLTVLSIDGTSNFINNSGFVGGAIHTSDNTTISLNGINNFVNNSVGAGGAICAFRNTIVSFSGTNNFINNSAVGGDGGAIYTSDNVLLSFSGTNNFINNSAIFGGAIFTSGNTLLSFNGTTNFINNSADYGGAIFADSNSSLIFNRTINFSNNQGGKLSTGGGVYMGFKSTFSILSGTTVYWENNHATLGGAIYVHDASPISYCTKVTKYVPKEECFFQLPDQNLYNGIDVQLIFKNNSADDAGSVLYGGAIENCKLIDLESYSSGEVFDMIAHIENDNTPSYISSDPIVICPCEHNIPQCSVSWHNFPYTVYPGEMFQVSMVAAGQRNGTVSGGVVHVQEQFPRTIILHSQYLQPANNTCTTLNYTVFSLDQNAAVELQPEGSPCSNFGKYALKIILQLNQVCPPGFNISESTQSCVCEPRLAHYTQSECRITNGLGQITRNSHHQFWVGYNDKSHELILHPLCPIDYCVTGKVVFSLNNTDMQCAHNRSGLLCGACKDGYSLVLGTSQCEQCTNNYIFLLIPFAVMGVALVFFLLICKLTVATGTLSGLVFYANIVGVNRTIFLPAESTDALSVFIAWLNLDFGIETCFYNGLDAYSKTWLQFVFPVYMWVIVGLMSLISHFSHRFANLLGNNPVSVFATLILLSYAKILRTLIAAFHITYLEYPTHNSMVWLYDASIGYLSGKHIPLFLVAVLVFVFLFLPYTLLLLFGQWLQAVSHLRLFSKVNKLKPFLDAYHAPYKAKHRYWPGLLLILRFVLLLVFALNPQQDPNTNLLVILVGTGIIQMWAWVSGGVYRNWCLDALEGSFALNLIILAAFTMYVHNVTDSEGDRLAEKTQLAIGYTSASIVHATFFGILVFQLANVTGITQSLQRKYTAMKAGIQNLHQAEVEVQSPTDMLPDRLVNPGEYEWPYYTSQRHTIVEPTDELVDEAQERLTPVYTYGSIN